MPRDVEHFQGRLEKDTYTKDEVAGLLHSEAEFSTRKATEGMVAAEEFTAVKDELNTYKVSEFKQTVSQTFTKLNGAADRVGDFMTLSGINQDMTPEEIENKVVEMKDNQKYGFMFTNTSSGAVVGPQNTKLSGDKRVVVNNLTTKASIWDKFKK